MRDKIKYNQYNIGKILKKYNNQRKIKYTCQKSVKKQRREFVFLKKINNV